MATVNPQSVIAAAFIAKISSSARRLTGDDKAVIPDE